MRILFRVGQWMLCIFVFATYSTSSSEFVSDADAKPKRSKNKGKKSKNAHIRRCVNFTQVLGENKESVEFTLHNSCEKEIECTMEWKLLCDSDTLDSPSEHPKSSQLLLSSESWEQTASASVCESDWRVSAVRWNCVSAASES